MKKLLAGVIAAALAIAPIAAIAQPPKPAYVSGAPTSGNCVSWAGAQTLQDAGSACAGITVDILSPQKPTGTLASVKQEYASVTNTSTNTLINYTGGSPGYISHLFIATLGSGCNPNSSSTVNVYIDGSGTPTISIPFQNFFLNTYSGGNTNPGPSVWQSKYIGQNNTGSSNFQQSHVFDIPIPFATGVKVDWVNNTGATCTLFSMVDYHTGVSNTWPYTRVLRAAVNTNVSGITANTATNLVNYTGGARGRLVGEWLLEDDVPGSISSFGASLEGDVLLYIDGSGSATLQSSGTEDWFGLGFYFGGNGKGGTQANASSLGQIQGGYVGNDGQIGITYISPGANYATEGAFRWHYADPVYFSSGLKITWACGATSQVSFTGTCDLYSTVFYYTES